jgi:hypothetical protein
MKGPKLWGRSLVGVPNSHDCVEAIHVLECMSTLLNIKVHSLHSSVIGDYVGGSYRIYHGQYFKQLINKSTQNPFKDKLL